MNGTAKRPQYVAALCGVLLAPLIGFDAARQAFASGCEEHPCADVLLKSRLDALLADDPAAGRLDARLAGKPWIAQNWAYAPFAATPSEASFAVRASTQHLYGYANGITARRFEAAKGMAPGLVMPKPVASTNGGLDVWSSIDVSDQRDETKGQLGADYRLTRNALVGLSAGWGESRDAGSAAAGESQRVALYATLRPAFPVSLDVRAQWGEQEGAVGDEALHASRNKVSARMAGLWRFDRVTFAPALSVSQEAESAAGGAATERNKIAVEPKFSRPFALGGGGTLEPFVSYKGVLGVEETAGGPATTSLTDSVGAGLSLARPEAFSMKLTTEVGRAVGGEEPSLNSRLELKVPLK